MAIYLFYPYDDTKTYSTISNIASGIAPHHPVPAVAPPTPAAIGAILRDGVYVSSLSTIVAADTLCIVGHGANGLKVLGSNDKKLGKDLSHINQTKIIQRLKEAGFTKEMQCRILVYSCYSAVPASDDGRCLAGLLAQQLKNDTYNCYNKVYGTLGPAATSSAVHNNQLCVYTKNEFYQVEWCVIDWANLANSPTKLVSPSF